MGVVGGWILYPSHVIIDKIRIGTCYVGEIDTNHENDFNEN